MKITKPDAIRLLEEAVQRRGPETVVLRCSYAKPNPEYDSTWGASAYLDDKPNCIVGEVVYSLNPDFLARINQGGLNSSGVEFMLKNILTAEDDITFTKPAIEVLDRAQVVQDGRSNVITDRTWKSALDAAKRKV